MTEILRGKRVRGQAGVVPPSGTAFAPQLLVVEDDADVAALLRTCLGELPSQVQVADDGHAGLGFALSDTWDLVILDIRLPRLSGLDVCREIRAAGRTMPILILTARGGEIDRVRGLELGADDYVAKPFSVLELRARVRALLRRTGVYQPATTLPAEERPGSQQFGRLRLDRVRRLATLDGKELSLAPREWDLLCFFADHPGQAFSRSELLDRVWGYGHDGYNHTVNSHINRLRAKLGDDHDAPRYIHTVWGTGYRFELTASG